MKTARRFAMILAACTGLATAGWTDLWPGEAPGAPPLPAGSEQDRDGRLGEIEKPQYWLHLPPAERANGAAVAIFPGGGYGILAHDKEGHEYARWLNERGIAAMVVKYRVSQDAAAGYGFPVPFLDARRAIRTLRAHAAEWRIDPAKIGVMGSSAGGHLASLCATRFDDALAEETADAVDRESCRPDFAVLIYPVITMDTTLGHTGSRARLLGESPAPELEERLSSTRAVGPRTPPSFLLTTADDRVDCRNSLEFAAACKRHGVPVALHLFETGGHGYGMRGQGDVADWERLLGDWLAKRYPAPAR